MKVQLLPSSYCVDGVSQRQHLSCIVIDDCVSLDAGSLAMSCSAEQRANIRDIIISHVHLDHIAGLPLFLDDLFATLEQPVRIHACAEMVELLERDIFNWSVYPRFSELKNEHGKIVEYNVLKIGAEVKIAHLTVKPIEVNHKVPSVGVLLSDDLVSVGITGDTAGTEQIWTEFNQCPDLAAVLVECAFPNDLIGLADASHHLTPSGLKRELAKLKKDMPVYVVNIKPMYRERVVEQIKDLAIPNLEILEIGRVYEF